MPQLNIQDFAPQLVWLAISFVLLYLVMSRVALPGIGKVLDERRTRIESDLAAAARLRDETEAAIADYEKALADARARGQSIARQARDEVTAELGKRRAEIDAQINAKMTDAEGRITELKKSAIGHIGEIAAETADALIARFVGKSVAKPELTDAVNEVLGK